MKVLIRKMSAFGVLKAQLIFGAIVIITYTVLGGFLAVSTTDLVQSIFMTIALIVIVFFGQKKVEQRFFLLNGRSKGRRAQRFGLGKRHGGGQPGRA